MAILMTNRPFVFLERLDQSFAKTIDGRERRKAADEMLALKKLLDEGILEQAEYEEKIKGLKERYLA